MKFFVAYERLCGFNRIGSDHPWSRVWKLWVAEQVPCLAQLLQHDRLMTICRLNYMWIGDPIVITMEMLLKIRCMS